MSAQPHPPRLTPEEYLRIERKAEFRSEYYDGQMYAMAGGTYRHALIMSNLNRRFGNAFEGRPCTVTQSDLRVAISSDGLYTYPDLVVVCGERRYIDNTLDTLLNPTLIIEVLSP